MELKEFITETVTAIIYSTSELQAKYDVDDVLINPPSAQSGSDVYQVNSPNYTMRRVQNIQFDVAVTASSETAGEGKAGIKVLSLDIGGSASGSKSAEQVSRVSFSVPVTLKPTRHENINTAHRERIEAENEAAHRRAQDAFSERGGIY